MWAAYCPGNSFYGSSIITEYDSWSTWSRNCSRRKPFRRKVWFRNNKKPSTQTVCGWRSLQQKTTRLDIVAKRYWRTLPYKNGKSFNWQNSTRRWLILLKMTSSPQWIAGFPVRSWAWVEYRKIGLVYLGFWRKLGLHLHTYRGLR